MEPIFRFLFESKYFGTNTLFDFLLFFLVLAAAVIVGRIVYFLFEQFVKTITKKTKTHFDDILIHALEKPVLLLLFALAWRLGANGFLDVSTAAGSFITGVFEVLVTIVVGWFLISFIDALIITYLKPLTERTETDLDDHLIPILQKLSRSVIIALTIIVMLTNLGYDVSALIAGLGIGGLAFALAAKDLLANIFGGVMILTDRPFKIGDMVMVQGVKGTVETIGLRTTILQSLDGTKHTIPNAMMTNAIIENITRANQRKVVLEIGLVYNTPKSKIEKAMSLVHAITEKNEHVQGDKTRVFFDNFGESALTIKVIYWIKNPKNLLTTKNEINLEIKKQFDKAKLNMAFPTRTIELIKK